MPAVKVARPFSWNHGRTHWRYGVGVYDIPDALLAHQYVLHHLEAAVLARGEALMQHRTPVLPWSPGDRYGVSLSRVSQIEPQDIQIWKWPPQLDQSWTFGPHVEPAPGAQLQVLERVPGGAEHEWQTALRAAATYPAPPYHGAGTYVHRPPLSWPFVTPQVGDLVQFGEPMSGGGPLAQLDMPRPNIPPESQTIRMYRQMQADAVAKMQTSVLLREAHIAAVDAMRLAALRDRAMPRADLEIVRARYGARAFVHPDFAPAIED
jgi:hypothetical protein